MSARLGSAGQNTALALRRRPVVLHLITQLGSGGAERMLTRIATFDHGPDAPRQAVISLMDEGVYGTTLRAAGVELHCMGMSRGRASPTALIGLIQRIRNIAPDLMMTWLYHADLLGTLAAPMTGITRIVWNLRNSELDFSRYAATTRVTVAALAKLSGRPRAVVTNSRAGQCAHEALGYTPRRWSYLPNGFDTYEWRPDSADREGVRAEWGLAIGAVAIGMIARVDPQKDHATFFAAAQRLITRHPEARFVCIGKGTEVLAVPGLLQGRMSMLGEQRDVPRLMRGLDIAVLSSAYGEGFPNVIGEAMATGVPCVVTDVGDAANIVGDTGVVTPPQDANRLADALALMIAAGARERERRGQGARARIISTYRIADIAGQYRALWEDVLAEA